MVSVCTVPARGGRSCEHFGGYKTINRIPFTFMYVCIYVCIYVIHTCMHAYMSYMSIKKHKNIR